MRILGIFLLVSLALAYAVPSLSSEWNVAAVDTRIRYTGRVSIDGPAVKFDWPCVYLTMRFKGSRVNVDMQGNEGRFSVFIDGNVQPHQIIITSDDRQAYELVSGLDPSVEHTLMLHKDTELCYQLIAGCTGITEIYAFYIDGEILDVPAPKMRKIAGVGDSESLGFGVASPTDECKFEAEANMCYFGPHANLARRLEADWVVTAFSAKGMYQNAAVGPVCRLLPGKTDSANQMCDTIPEIFPRTLVGEGTTDANTYNYQSYLPDVVVLWAGGNDVFTGIPKDPRFTDKFTETYTNFLMQLRAAYPDSAQTHILTVCGGPLENQAVICPWVDTAVQRVREQGEKSISSVYVPMETFVRPDDFGCLDHLNIVGMDKAVNIIEQAVRAAKGW